MENLKKLAYAFFIILIIGAVFHFMEAGNSYFGLITMFIGFAGLVIVFLLHVKDRVKFHKREKFEWKISHIGVLALVLIIIGIIISFICSFLFPDYIGIGSSFITIGFYVAVLGFFIFVVKERAFK